MRTIYLPGSLRNLHGIYILADASPEFWVGFFGFAGILVTQIVLFIQQRGNHGKIQETRDQVQDIHEEVRSPDGDGKTGLNVKRLHIEIVEHIRESREEHREFMSELTALAATMGAHMVDGHDPIANLTRDAPKRTGGRDDPTPPAHHLRPHEDE